MIDNWLTGNPQGVVYLVPGMLHRPFVQDKHGIFQFLPNSRTTQRSITETQHLLQLLEVTEHTMSPDSVDSIEQRAFAK